MLCSSKHLDSVIVLFFLAAAVSCVLCYTKSQKFIKRRGGCTEETAPRREIKDGDEERTEIDREEERREERAALLSNSPAKINPPREKQNILWNKTLASPSKNAATFIYYSQVSDKCLKEMEKLSLQLCFLCLNSACALSTTSTLPTQRRDTHLHTVAGSAEGEHLGWTVCRFNWLPVGGEWVISVKLVSTKRRQSSRSISPAGYYCLHIGHDKCSSRKLPVRYYNQIHLWLCSVAPVKSATEIIYDTQGKLCSVL